MTSSLDDQGDTGEQGTLALLVYITIPHVRITIDLLTERIEQLVQDARAHSAKVDLSIVSDTLDDSTALLTYTAMTHPLPRNRKVTIHGQDIVDNFFAWLDNNKFSYMVDEQIVMTLPQRKGGEDE
jgi:hypothetical protein